MTKVILSFDDGREDNYRAAKEILEPLGIPATFNVTTGYVIGDIDNKDKPGPHKPMSKEQLSYMFDKSLFEVAGHGYKHNNDVENLIQGVKALESVSGFRYKVRGIASPNSSFDLEDLKDAKIKMENEGVCYLRISNDYSKYNIFKRVVRKLNRWFKIPEVYYWTNKDSLMRSKDFLLFSVPVLRDTSIKEVKYLINKIVGQNLICILMFHSILKTNEKYYGDLFSWDYIEFEKLCRFLSELREQLKIEIQRTEELFNSEK